MKQIKCYHARRVQLVIDSEPQMFFEGPMITPLIAIITTDDEYKLSKEEIWDCCNNSCWWDHEDFRSMDDYRGKFRVRFTDDYSGYCNDDLIVEADGVFYVSRSFGWETLSSFNEAVKYCREHSYWCQLHTQGKQYPVGRECSMEALEQFKKMYEGMNFKCYLIHE